MKTMTWLAVTLGVGLEDGSVVTLGPSRLGWWQLGSPRSSDKSVASTAASFTAGGSDQCQLKGTKLRVWAHLTFGCQPLIGNGFCIPLLSRDCSIARAKMNHFNRFHRSTFQNQLIILSKFWKSIHFWTFFHSPIQFPKPVLVIFWLIRRSCPCQASTKASPKHLSPAKLQSPSSNWAIGLFKRTEINQVVGYWWSVLLSVSRGTFDTAHSIFVSPGYETGLMRFNWTLAFVCLARVSLSHDSKESM